LLVDGSTTEKLEMMPNGDNAPLKTVMQIKKTTETMGVELNYHNDRPCSFGLKQGSDCQCFWVEQHDCNTPILLLEGNVHIVRLFIQMSGLQCI